VNGLAACVQAFTQPGDAVLVFTPVYPPFFDVVRLNQRQLIELPLQLDATVFRYEIDWGGLEEAVKQFHVKLLLLSNPQNPSGRVWTTDELARLGLLCEQYGVKVVSDEVHSDLVFSPAVHQPFASVNACNAALCVTLNAPSKTFNLGGLSIAYAIVQAPALRAALAQQLKACAIKQLNLLNQCVLEQVYQPAGVEWLGQLMHELTDLRQIMLDGLAKQAPQIQVMRPEASYLLWLNFEALGFTHAQLVRWLIEEKGLGLSDGNLFGQGYAGWMRMNFAMPHPLLKASLARW
jgi:cystathionine beta-lyase